MYSARRDFARLRTSSHSLEIEVGRYHRPKIPREERKCNLCKSGEVENEMHFLLHCEYFKEIRKPLLHALAPRLPFVIDKSVECFTNIFSCSNGNPQVSKIVCSLAKSLSLSRFEMKTLNPQF